MRSVSDGIGDPDRRHEAQLVVVVKMPWEELPAPMAWEPSAVHAMLPNQR